MFVTGYCTRVHDECALKYAQIFPFCTSHCTLSAHEVGHVQTAPFRQLAGSDPPEGPINVGESFRRRKDAEEWALDNERRIDRGETPLSRARIDPTRLEDLIDLHLLDMKEVGKCPRRSKAFSLESLKKKLGSVKLAGLTRERLIQFGRDRAKEGAGPVTVAMDLTYLKTVIAHAAAVHGLKVSGEQVDLARLALKRLGIVGKGRVRDRRPWPDEITQLIDYFESNERQLIPVGRLIRFAIATAMRQDEICRLDLTHFRTFGDSSTDVRKSPIMDIRNVRFPSSRPIVPVSDYPH